MGRPRQTHCKRGHSLEDAYVNKGARPGSRRCRVCAQDASKEYGRAHYVPKPRPVPSIPRDVATLAYAAGIVDGEGSIIIRLLAKKGSSERRYHNLHVSVSNTDPRLTDWLQEKFGGRVTVHGHAASPNRSPATQWNLLARHAEELLRAIRPYMVVKADQADVALAMRATTTEMGRGDLTDELFAYRESLRLELQRLKRLRRLMPSAETQGDTL